MQFFPYRGGCIFKSLSSFCKLCVYTLRKCGISISIYISDTSLNKVCFSMFKLQIFDTNCLSEFAHFVGLVLKRLKSCHSININPYLSNVPILYPLFPSIGQKCVKLGQEVTHHKTIGILQKFLTRISRRK